MKIIAVYLSTRKGSVSEKIVDELTRGAEEAGAVVSRYKIGDSILGCRGCAACVKAGKCVIQDPLAPYWDDLQDADMVIVGAANFMGNVQGQAWSFMNRHFSMADTSRGRENRVIRFPAGKRIMGVFAQGQPDKGFYREVYRNYLRIFANYGLIPQEPMVVHATDLTEERLAGCRAEGRAWVEQMKESTEN